MASGRSARPTVGLITLVAALACGCSPILSTAAPAGTSQPAPPTVAPAGTSLPALPTVVITRLPPPPTRVSPTPFAASVPRAQGEVQLGEGRVLRIGTGLRSRPVWFSDGRFIAEPGTDGIHILDGATLEPLRHLFSPVRDRVIAVSPDGDLIISASMGSMAPVEVWNTRTGDWFRTLGAAASASAPTISPDGRLVAIDLVSGVALWNIADGVKLRELRGTSDGNTGHIVFSPDSRYLAVATDRGLNLWDVTSFDRVASIPSGEGYANPIFSPDSSRMAYGDSNRSIAVFDLRTKTMIASLVSPSSYRGHATALAFSHDGSRIAAGISELGGMNRDSANRILVWDADTFRAVGEHVGHSETIDRVAFSRDDRYVVSLSQHDQSVRQWNVAEGKLERVVDSDATWFDLSPDGRLVLTTGPNADRVWSVQTGLPVRLAQRLNGAMSSPVFDLTGNRIAFGVDQDVMVRDTRTGAILLRLKGHTRQVDRVLFSPDGRMLASSSLDEVIRLWNAEDGALVGELANPLPYVDFHTTRVPERSVAPQIAFSRDGRWLASGSFQSEVRFWDVRERRMTRTQRTDELVVAGLSFSPDGSMMAALSATGHQRSLQVWDMATGAQSLAINDGNNAAGDIVFSPDGRLIAVASNRMTINVWNAHGGSLAAELYGHKSGVTSLAFNTDGSRLASGGYDKYTIVWDMGRNIPLFSDLSHTDFVNGIAFSPDGRTVASSSALDGSIFFWVFDPG